MLWFCHIKSRLCSDYQSKNENNYVDNCWQIRVYEPIYTFERI